jgi:hypothetical protein
MRYRYDFVGDKLDLPKFQKQAAYYIGHMREVNYEIFLKNYKLLVEIATPDNCTGHIVTLSMHDLKRDSDGDISSEKVIIPLIDTRFKESKIIKEFFVIDNYKAHFESNNVSLTVDKISQLIKLLFKINSLKAFL